MNDWSEKAGRMLMVGLSGEELTAEERTILAEYPIGNFILFSQNLRGPDQIVGLCRSLWERGKEPPFIAIDHEGGRVHRLPEPFTRFPAASVLGQTRKAELAYAVGTAMGRELSAAGVNLNFAPVLDVLSNPANPAIGDRSLSSEPRDVDRLGGEIARGLKDGGVVACGKHFPGHGGTDRDSHAELPVVAKAREELDACELVPFVEACRKRIEALMVAHVLYSALDPERPATLSGKIVGDLLRSKLAYDGVAFSDDLEMRAITDGYSPEEAAALALEAGLDILIFGRSIENAARAFESLRRTAERRESARSKIEESCNRITRLKRRRLQSFSGRRGAEFRKAADLERHARLAALVQGSL